MRGVGLQVVLSIAIGASGVAQAQAPPGAVTHGRITVLSDAFGRTDGLARDWGYAALIEYGDRRILFDTGNDAEHFAANVKTLGVDLTRLDAVVISHRHGDHTDGLRHLLAVNPQVRIYVPDDEYFGGPTPPVFFRHADPSLPADMRYFGGNLPDVVPHGSAWRAPFVRVDRGRELFPGVRLVRNIAPGREFGETPELSLVLDTPTGPVVVVGCSHPGIERILASVAEGAPAIPPATPPATAARPPVRMVVGGLHLVTTAPSDVDALVSRLRTDWRVGAIAPGHCTGEHAFTRLSKGFGSAYVYAGVGEVIAWP